jgi:rubredoxin
MNKRFLTVLLSMTVVSAALLAGPASADTQKSPAKKLSTSSDVKFKRKLGYYVECRYSGLGEVCDYVYAKPKGSDKLQRIKATDSKLKTRLGYYVECHYSGLGEVCEYVYATVKPKP